MSRDLPLQSSPKCFPCSNSLSNHKVLQKQRGTTFSQPMVYFHTSRTRARGYNTRTECLIDIPGTWILIPILHIFRPRLFQVSHSTCLKLKAQTSSSILVVPTATKRKSCKSKHASAHASWPRTRNTPTPRSIARDVVLTRRSPRGPATRCSCVLTESDTMCQHDNTDVERSGHATVISGAGHQRSLVVIMWSGVATPRHRTHEPTMTILTHGTAQLCR